jgi:hypothetical protein
VLGAEVGRPLYRSQLDPAVEFLSLCDQEAAKRFQHGTWHATALREAGIEVMVAEPPTELSIAIREAQIRQFR